MPPAEHEPVDAAQHRRQRPRLPHHAAREQGQREPRRLGAAGDQLARVGTLAAHAQQPAVVIQQVLHRRCVQPARLHQPQHHPRVEPAGARAHHHAVQRRHAHRRVRAPPAAQRAQAGARAEMGHDHPPGRQRRLHLRQLPGDVLVAQSVEPVPARTRLGERAAATAAPWPVRPSSRGSWCRNRPPAAGRAAPSATARIAARLCGWCSGANCHQRLDLRDHPVIHPGRPSPVTAMHDPVPHRTHLAALVMPVDPAQQLAQPLRLHPVRPGLLRLPRLQPRAVPQRRDLPAQHGPAPRLERREFQAAAAGIERQDQAHAGHSQSRTSGRSTPCSCT